VFAMLLNALTEEKNLVASKIARKQKKDLLRVSSRLDVS